MITVLQIDITNLNPRYKTTRREQRGSNNPRAKQKEQNRKEKVTPTGAVVAADLTAQGSGLRARYTCTETLRGHPMNLRLRLA